MGVVRGQGIGVGVGTRSGQGISVGISALSPLMTINGTTELPIISLKGGDASAATWNAWGYGPNFTALGSGGIFNVAGPGTGALDYSVDLQGTRYYEDATSGNIGTDDWIAEFVFTMGTVGRLAAKRDAAPDKGWDVVPVAGTFWFFIKDSAGVSRAPATGALVAGTSYHAIIFGDRSGSAQWYVDGSASGLPVNIAGLLTIDSATNLQIGAQRGGSIGDHSISYFRLWRGAAWLDTHLQAAVALDRYSKYAGL